MKIRELTQKAENLIEQGDNAKQRQLHYQQEVISARAQVISAYARLETAESETDENGNPTGDVSGARAAVYAAQALLKSAESGLAEANRQLEGIQKRKMDAVHEFEKYNAVEESNMSKLAELQQKRFGTNVNAFMADLAARMNSGEQARVQLLASMGIVASAKTFSATNCYQENHNEKYHSGMRENRASDDIKVFSSKVYQDIVDELKANGVEYKAIHSFGRTRTSEEIAAMISGGDLTEGSCSSLAFAFIGNEAGYYVLDFRDGNSRKFFATRESIKKIASLPGVVSNIEYGTDDVACVEKLLKNVSSGKNYYLATGGHAAIIRQNGNHLEYLELQHPGNGNGWHKLDDNILINRFGCSKKRRYKISNFLIETESLSKSQEFLDILGYINTNSNEQRKGSSGYVK